MLNTDNPKKNHDRFYHQNKKVEGDEIHEGEQLCAVSDFKSALAESLLSSYPAEKEGMICLDSIPSHIRKEGLKAIEKKVFGDRVPIGELPNIYLHTYCYSATRNCLLANGLQNVYGINSIVHRQQNEEEVLGLSTKLPYNHVEVNQSELQEALKNEIGNSKKVLQHIFRNAKCFGDSYSLTAKKMELPNLLFSVWSITENLPNSNDVTLLAKELSNGKLGENFYSVHLSKDTVEEFARRLETEFSCKLNLPTSEREAGGRSK